MRILSVVVLFCAVVCSLSQPFLPGMIPPMMPPMIPPMIPPFGLGMGLGMGFPFSPFGFGPFGFGFGRFGFGRFGGFGGRFGGFGRRFGREVDSNDEKVMEQLAEIDTNKVDNKKDIEKLAGAFLDGQTTIKKDVQSVVDTIDKKEISRVEPSKVVPTEVLGDNVIDKKDISKLDTITGDKFTPLDKKDVEKIDLADRITGDKVVDTLTEVKKDLNKIISEKSAEETPKKACAKSGC